MRFTTASSNDKTHLYSLRRTGKQWDPRPARAAVLLLAPPSLSEVKKPTQNTSELSSVIFSEVKFDWPEPVELFYTKTTNIVLQDFALRRRQKIYIDLSGKSPRRYGEGSGCFLELKEQKGLSAEVLSQSTDARTDSDTPAATSGLKIRPAFHWTRAENTRSTDLTTPLPQWRIQHEKTCERVGTSPRKPGADLHGILDLEREKSQREWCACARVPPRG